jgi:hypothetical protein
MKWCLFDMWICHCSAVVIGAYGLSGVGGLGVMKKERGTV